MIFGCQEEIEEDQHVELISPEEFLLPLGRVRVPSEFSCDIRIVEEAFGDDSRERRLWPRRLPVNRFASPPRPMDDLLDEARGGPAEEVTEEASIAPVAEPDRLQLIAELLRLLSSANPREREILWAAPVERLQLTLEILRSSTSTISSRIFI